MYEWLDVALDYGVAEAEFWFMTFGELTRLIDSKKRVQKEEQKQKAIFDYTLANMIGYSVARIHSSKNKMPTLNEAYPALFEDVANSEEAQAAQKELSILRFKLFAQSYNTRYKDGEKDWQKKN